MKKKIISLAVFGLITGVAQAGGSNVVYVAPTATINTAPDLTSLNKINSTVINTLGSTWGYTGDSSAVTNASEKVVLGVKLALPSFSGVDIAPTYSSTNHQMSYVNGSAFNQVWNGFDMVKLGSASAYNSAALAYDNAIGNYMVAAMTKGSYGFNGFLNAIDGGSRNVNGVTTATATSIAADIATFNAVNTNAIDKFSALQTIKNDFVAIQAQATALDSQTTTTVNVLNNSILPTAGAPMTSFSAQGVLNYTNLQ